MGNIITPVLPHDLPENWNDTQYVSPGGTEVGLTEKHGYNYLMKQVNNSQKAINELDAEMKDIDTTLANKAPAGFGLGTVATYLTEADDLNTIGKGGWYWWTSFIPKNSPLAFCTMRVDPGELETGSYATQTIYYIGQNKGAKLRRYNVDGTWQPWEWVNPPMMLGVEYRTTERYNGKPVYAKLIDFGALPNSTVKQVYISEEEVIPIWFEGKIDNHHTIMRDGYLPGTFGTGGHYVITALSISNNLKNNGIAVKTSEDLSGYTAKVHVKYIKASD